MEEIAKAFGLLDILVDCAGITSIVLFKNLDGLAEVMWDKMIAVNVKGIFFCSRAVSRVVQRDNSVYRTRR